MYFNKTGKNACKFNYYVHGPLLNSNYDVLFKREFVKKNKMKI